MIQAVQMKTVADLKFPNLSFSPLAASSPKVSKFKNSPQTRNHSWNSANSTDSSGNITGIAIAGVNESHLKIHDDSLTSLRTALEYVDPKKLSRNGCNAMLTREELRTAIYNRKMAEETPNEALAEFYSFVVTERILWNYCRVWSGTLPVSSKDELTKFVDYACNDWYMLYTALVCTNELKDISEMDQFDKMSVAAYCYNNGISMRVVDRIFEKNLVRQSSGDCLDLVDVVRLLFAITGTDEPQTFEYWFRILDINSTGVLSFHCLNEFYERIAIFLCAENVTVLSFEDVITQYCDILGTSVWTLKAFKKNSRLAGRVLNGFVNALRFLEQETDEKMNTDRQDDEEFGEGERSCWQRMIDHQYSDFYQNTSWNNSTFIARKNE